MDLGHYPFHDRLFPVTLLTAEFQMTLTEIFCRVLKIICKKTR